MVAVQHFAETYLVPVQLLLAMLGMGATLTPTDFALVLRERVAVGVGLALQWLFVPALSLAAIEVLALSPGWAVGLLLIAVVPGGTASNLFTHLGKGNAALSVALTVVTTLAAVVSVPLMLDLFAGGYVPSNFRFPTGRVVTEITLYLLLPVGVGMWVLRRWPQQAPHIARLCIRVSVLLIAFLVVSSMGSGRIQVGAYGWRPPLILIGLGTTLALLTPILCRLMRCYEEDAAAISIEVCVRNVGLALLLVRHFFPDDPAQGQVLYSCLFYAGMSLAVVFAEVARATPGDRTLMNAGLAYALAKVAALAHAQDDATAAPRVHPAVAQALSLMDGDGLRLDRAQLAERCGLSASQLSRLFVRELGQPLSEVRNRRRLHRFAELMQSERCQTMLEAALEAGFGSYAQFHRVHRKLIGQSPARTWGEGR